MKRRDFLKSALTGAAVLGAGSLVSGSLTEAFAQKASGNNPAGGNGAKGKKPLKLGAAIAVFKPMDYQIAAPHIKAAGYDGTTVVLNTLVDNFRTAMWRDEIKRLNAIAADNGLEFISAGTGDHDPERTRKLFETAAELGVSIVCTGPNGVTGDEASLNQSIADLGAMAQIAQEFRIPLVCKAHDGGSIHNTAEALRMVKAITNPWFGADIDPYHVVLAHDSLTEAAKALVPYLKYAHVQDFKLTPEGKFMKSTPVERAIGRGDLDITGYLEVLLDGNYDGPLMVELYGDAMDLNTAISVTAQGHGYLNACLKLLGEK